MTAVIVDEEEDDDDDGRGGGRRDDEGDISFIARALPRWLEFDGRDTIFGTPRQEDAGTHRVRLRARVKGDHDDQNFSIDVASSPINPLPDEADLAASISVSPESASVGEWISWTATARNLADADVANFVLETEIFGDASFSIDEVDDSFCSIEPRGSVTAVVCRWSPLPSGASRSAELRGQATRAGSLFAIASVAIVDTVPTDRDAGNDEAAVVVRVSDGGQDGGSVDDFPVLTLNGPSAITVLVGDPYEDPGATASDGTDGNLTDSIVVDNPVDTRIIGRYSVTYDVVDSAGNTSTTTRLVEIVPREGVGGGGGGAAGLSLLMLGLLGAFARARTSALSSR
jgi:hypothetical protein